jgi:putative oxidoreductase
VTKKIFAPGNDSTLTSLGLLVLRLWLGLAMFFNHGLAKLTHFSDMASKFPDPLGIGQTPSLALVVFAETAGALLLALGLLTRFAALTLVIDLGIAFILVHKAASGAGEGRFSVDKALFGKGK